MLKLVKDRKKIDIDKLPTPETVAKLYQKGTKIEHNHLNFIVEFYKRKIDLYEKFAIGADLKAVKWDNKTKSL